MPRQSAASRAVNVTGKAAIRPRSGLSADLAARFRAIVSKARADHFVPSDAPLLERYVEAHALAELAQEHIAAEGPVTREGKVSPWVLVAEKSNRSVVALAGKLRLCPQARLDRKTAGATTRAPAPKPWEDEA